MANLKTSAELSGAPVKIEDLFRIASYVSPGVYVSASISGQHMLNFINAFPAGSDAEIQFNNAGAFGASAKLAWVDASNTLNLGEPDNSGNIVGFPGTALATTGTRINVRAGAGYDDGMGGASNGGAVEVSAGAGKNAGSGGAFAFYGGDSAGGAAGPADIYGGYSDTGTGGGATVGGGGADVGTPGDANLIAGAADTEGPGADANITASDGVADSNPDQNGGNVNITIGLATGAGIAGNLIISNLPTSDPAIPGAVYQSSGVLMVSL